MNPEANRRLPSAAQAMAAKALMLWSADLLAKVMPAPGTTLRDQSVEAMKKKLSQMREEFAHMTFPEMNPVESDMWTQEALEAFDDLASQFLKKVLDQ
jgi:phenylalanyl-tRNA synthetase alpha subunit